LAGDEGGPPGGAGLLTVAVGEHHAFRGQAIDAISSRTLIALLPVPVLSSDYSNSAKKYETMAVQRRGMPCWKTLSGGPEPA
jgi:hypothetical protein